MLNDETWSSDRFQQLMAFVELCIHCASGDRGLSQLSTGSLYGFRAFDGTVWTLPMYQTDSLVTP
jgi:hypothetical protein